MTTSKACPSNETSAKLHKSVMCILCLMRQHWLSVVFLNRLEKAGTSEITSVTNKHVFQYMSRLISIQI